MSEGKASRMFLHSSLILPRQLPIALCTCIVNTSNARRVERTKVLRGAQAADTAKLTTSKSTSKQRASGTGEISGRQIWLGPVAGQRTFERTANGASSTTKATS